MPFAPVAVADREERFAALVPHRKCPVTTVVRDNSARNSAAALHGRMMLLWIVSGL
jgi:hypothetical protein